MTPPITIHAWQSCRSAAGFQAAMGGLPPASRRLRAAGGQAAAAPRHQQQAAAALKVALIVTLERLVFKLLLVRADY